MKAMSDKIVRLWRFPPEDFAAWRAMVGGSQLESYEGYLAVLGEAAEVAAAQNLEVEIVSATVQEMRDWLKSTARANTPSNRAAAVGCKLGGLGRAMGLKITAKVVAHAVVDLGHSLRKSAEVPIVDGDIRAAIRQAIENFTD